ncbi:antitoxin component YwqK of YwqJK toxin-antitoxin module [Olleya sp. Hel_I_94]|nr:antitoxin component YwqK of YwqJK toxin-antitoxin module [Olleya sp. Hel_I_94]
MINLLNLFGCKAQKENDPYWEFDKTEHFRPELNKAEFFKLSGYDFGWFVLEPISKFVKDKEFEIEKGKSLSYGQKALYYWWYLDAQVTNGGFVQFYYNGYGPYIPTIIKGLEHIGDNEMANLVKKADKIYQKNKKLMDKAQESDLFESNLYDRLDELSLLDDDYYEMNKKTMSLIESYIRKNPNEVCLDEDGKEFDMTFTGLCKTFYDNKKIKEEFQLEKGFINGEFKSFYDNGKPKEVIHYLNGEHTGEQKEFYDNGKLKYQVTKEPSKNIFIQEWYYDNGNPKKLESKLIEKNERIGEYKEWYENGQLSETEIYKSAYEREGDWLEFYENGNKKVEAEFINGKYILKNYWNEKGKQTLITGTGYSEFYSKSNFKDDTPELHYREYKNFIPHGVWKELKNDTLQRLVNYQNGKRHGKMEVYYNNGNLKEETIYENGNSVSTKKFRKFKNPKVKTFVVSRICKGCYKDYEEYQLPENDPKPLNDLELTVNFQAEPSIFEPYGDDHIMFYGYYAFVNEKGLIDEIKFAVADNMWLDEQVKASMSKLKFETALKDGKPIKSIHYVRYKLKLIE